MIDIELQRARSAMAESVTLPIAMWLEALDELEALRQTRLVQQAEQEPVHESLQIAAVALQDIACSSQTNNLLWWQIRAREAQKQITERLTNSAPAEPVKQEPVAWCELTKAGEIAYFDGKPIIMPGKIGNDCHPTPLYAAPARTKDLTDDEIHDVFKSLGFSLADPRTEDFSVARAVIAKFKEKNRG